MLFHSNFSIHIHTVSIWYTLQVFGIHVVLSSQMYSSKLACNFFVYILEIPPRTITSSCLTILCYQLVLWWPITCNLFVILLQNSPSSSSSSPSWQFGDWSQWSRTAPRQPSAPHRDATACCCLVTVSTSACIYVCICILMCTLHLFVPSWYTIVLSCLDRPSQVAELSRSFFVTSATKMP